MILMYTPKIKDCFMERRHLWHRLKGRQAQRQINTATKVKELRRPIRMKDLDSNIIVTVT